MPIDDSTRIITELKPRKGKENVYGGSLIPIYFHLPGPAAAIECDHFVLPYRMHLDLLMINVTSGPGASTLFIRGLNNGDEATAVDMAGPYASGSVYRKFPAAIEPYALGTRIYPEITSPNEVDIGITITIIGSPVTGAPFDPDDDEGSVPPG